MNEPAIDLGIVMALVSSYKNRPIDEKTIVFGEVGLKWRSTCCEYAGTACGRGEEAWV